MEGTIEVNETPLTMPQYKPSEINQYFRSRKDIRTFYNNGTDLDSLDI